MNFAEKMDELEKILRDLEGDSLTLDSALAEYERGSRARSRMPRLSRGRAEKITMLSQEYAAPQTGAEEA